MSGIHFQMINHSNIKTTWFNIFKPAGNRLYFICAFILAISCISIQAQHTAVYNTLVKVQDYYKTHPDLSFDMNFTMYENYSSSKIVHQTAGSYQVHQSSLLIKMGGQTQLLNDAYSVVADEATQTLVVQENLAKVNNKTPMGLDSLVNLFTEVKVIKDSSEIIRLEFKGPRQAFYTISKFTVDVAKSSGRITAAVLYYAFDISEFYNDYGKKTIPRIEISYHNYIENNPFSSNTFSEAAFFKINNNKIVPTGTYANYRLVDLRAGANQK